MDILSTIGVALISGLGGTIGWLPGLLPIEFGWETPAQGFSPRQ